MKFTLLEINGASVSEPSGAVTESSARKKIGIQHQFTDLLSELEKILHCCDWKNFNCEEREALPSCAASSDTCDAKMKGETQFGKDENLPLRYAYFRVH